jgi:hypothetical protein
MISENVTGCYFETNDYGFRQKRIYGENLYIERADNQRGLESKDILNPSKFLGKYGG